MRKEINVNYIKGLNVTKTKYFRQKVHVKMYLKNLQKFIHPNKIATFI